MTQPFRRPYHAGLLARLAEPRHRMQVIMGPRQVGKTTLVLQVLQELALPHVYVSADEPHLQPPGWIAAAWEGARQRLSAERPAPGVVLVIDEVQKLPNWSETVKRLWDEDTREGRPIHVVLLGSSPLLRQAGLRESMAGRFEVVHIPHWSYLEMHDAFGWSLDTFIYFGGYPGGAGLIGDEARWKTYVRESLVETTISRDVLFLKRIDKPGLLRQLMALATVYSGQIVSFTKLLGQLQDSGNTTIISDYLHLLEGVGMVSGLQKYSASGIRQRASSPKLQVWNTGLLTSLANQTRATARADGVFWGHLVESCVGAHLLNTTRGTAIEVLYWAAAGRELDFVLRRGNQVLGIEVKSGRPRPAHGLEAFLHHHPGARGLIVGEGGVSLEKVLSAPAERLLG